MSFSIRPFPRFPVPCSVTYHAGPFLKMPLAYYSSLGSVTPVEGGLILHWEEISILYGTR